MPLALKKILALLIGLLVSIGTIALLEQFSHWLYPPASTPDWQDPSAVAAYMQSLPVMAYLLVLLAWFSGVVAGIVVATLLVKRVSRLFVVVITAMVWLATLANVYLIPHPLWVSVTALFLLPLAGWLTGRWLHRCYPHHTETEIVD
ncbi:hypothetical protein [Rheinheimera sp.]|uniref:hypothetical protein n=1 Tax=Rheinheimera sp. TaxID=1869214 RepID=UPI0027BA4F96|nr:hypothetical protein [Rheinheimera sp.]